jgi:hypothetical protein
MVRQESDADWILSSAPKISKAKSALLRLEFDGGCSREKANVAMDDLLSIRRMALQRRGLRNLEV